MKPEQLVIVTKMFLITLFFCLIGNMSPVLAGEIDEGLENILKETPSDMAISVLVYMNEQVDLRAITNEMDNQKATLQNRHEVVVTSLQEIATSTKGNLIAYLTKAQSEGKVHDFKAFWITNAVWVKAEKAEIEKISKRSDVARVYFNYEIELIEPVEIGKDDPGLITSIESGVTAVRAPEVWSLGIDGSGVLVANMDTGVEGSHPALASRWAGVADPRYAGHPEWAWYDPYLNQNDFPYDNHGHGTHTMGSVCGASQTTGDTVGVAPGAFWMASAPIDRGGGIPGTVADAILSFEWMTDPDGNPETNWDVPAVCSNSWGLVTSHGYPPCDTLFWSYLDACEAAGTVILFSAGNEGYSGLRRPADRATDAYRTCAVAAVDGNNPSWPIASFSSRGPTYCTPDGSAAIKPDIAAPGVSVRSCYPGGGYTSMSGTSMASPHVNGVVALMRQANPNISVEMIKQIIYDTAYDLGPAGEDNSYGWGMIDAYEAVMMAMTDFGYVDGLVTDAENSNPLPASIEVVGTLLSVQADDSGYYIVGLPADTTYTLRASLFGYFSQEQSIYVAIDDTVSLDFVLVPVPPPDLVYTPSSFNVITQPGNIETRNLTITNNGDGPLYFTLWTEIYDIISNINRTSESQPEPLGYRITDTGKISADYEPYYPPIITSQGGPDNFGHIWIDSDEPGGPSFNWIDITSVGVPIDFGSDIDDGNSGPLLLGFDFQFYGNQHNSINVCTNGWASFTNGTSTEFGNPPIPDIEQPNDLLAVFFDDMNLENGGTGYFYTNNIDTAIITWDHVPDWRQEGIFTFQIILKAPSKIKYQYFEMGPGRLDECTIGIENSDASDGLQVVSNAAYMHNNLAIGFFTDWLTVSPLTGIVDPYNSFDAVVTFDASMLDEGMCNGNINLESNDPDSPDVDIACTFTVATSSVVDVGVSGIISPPDSMETGSSYTLESEVRNYSTESQTFDVVYEIYKLGSSIVEVADTVAIVNMSPSSTDTVLFTPSFIPDEDTTFNLVSYTLLESDMNNSNDTCSVLSNSYTWLSVWYGNIDNSPIMGYPDSRVSIDVYVQTPENAYVGYLHTCLGTDDQYIDSLLGVDEGLLYYPLTDWENASFLIPEGSPPNSGGWSSQSFVGQTIPANPWLHFETPTRIMTFKVKTVDDTTLIGDSYPCLGAGINSVFGFSSARDTLSNRGYPLTELFSELFFDEPETGCVFVPGDINGDGNVIGGDVTYAVNFFRGFGSPPPDSCWNDVEQEWLYSAGDANGDCQFIGSDITYLVSYFRGTNPPPQYCPQTPPSGGGILLDIDNAVEESIDNRNKK